MGLAVRFVAGGSSSEKQTLTMVHSLPVLVMTLWDSIMKVLFCCGEHFSKAFLWTFMVLVVAFFSWSSDEFASVVSPAEETKAFSENSQCSGRCLTKKLPLSVHTQLQLSPVLKKITLDPNVWVTRQELQKILSSLDGQQAQLRGQPKAFDRRLKFQGRVRG